MPSRQDQLHSYQYSLQRVVAALVTHDPDPSRSPLRRAGMTALVSLLVASLAVAAAAIYGLLTGHSNANPKDATVVFQEKGTGARYVFLKSDEKLHPVLNFASGLLLAEAEAPQLKSISAEKLASIPLGPPLGIPDAPDSLPRKDALISERWSVCTDNTDDAARSTLLVGTRLTDGTIPAQSGKAMLVREPNGGTSLIAGNRRFPIPTDRLVATRRALGWGDQEGWPVSVAWLNAVPLGPTLRAPTIPGAEIQGARFGGYPVGQVVSDGDKSVGVILEDGLADITAMQAALIRAATGEDALAIGAEYVRVPQSKIKISDSGDIDSLPPTVPELIGGQPTRACITLPPDPKTGDGVRIDPTMPTNAEPVTTANQLTKNKVLADYVYVARGGGVLAASAASPTAPESTGPVSIVTDEGYCYPLASRALITKLGYGGVKPRAIPAVLLSLLPEGPALDPQEARRTDVQ